MLHLWRGSPRKERVTQGITVSFPVSPCCFGELVNCDRPAPVAKYTPTQQHNYIAGHTGGWKWSKGPPKKLLLPTQLYEMCVSVLHGCFEEHASLVCTENSARMHQYTGPVQKRSLSNPKCLRSLTTFAQLANHFSGPLAEIAVSHNCSSIVALTDEMN